MTHKTKEEIEMKGKEGEFLCACCFDDIVPDSYVEYQSSSHSEWLSSVYCVGCIEILIQSQWNQYVNALATTKCKAEQRRLLTAGPPVNVRDPKGLPCPDDCEVYMFWYMRDEQEHSAKLQGSLEGEVIF
jgi:hypothetical protein